MFPGKQDLSCVLPVLGAAVPAVPRAESRGGGALQGHKQFAWRGPVQILVMGKLKGGILVTDSGRRPHSATSQASATGAASTTVSGN